MQVYFQGQQQTSQLTLPIRIQIHPYKEQVGLGFLPLVACKPSWIPKKPEKISSKLFEIDNETDRMRFQIIHIRK